MGTDKALLEVDGIPLLGRAIDALRRAGAVEVVVVGGGAGVRSLAGARGVRVLDDLLPGAGPLAGVAAALTALEDVDAVLVVACDHPDLDPASLHRLADTLIGLPGAMVALPTRAADAPLDVLHAAYRPALGSLLRGALAGGERSLRRILETLPVVAVPVAPASLVDLDTPEDLGRREGARGSHGLPSSPMDPAVPSVDVHQLHDLLAAGPVALIDVREPDEHREARVSGIRAVPLQTVPDALGTIPTTGPVYVICAAGGRSMRAAEFLRSNGIDAVNVAGGTNAWIQAGYDVESGPMP